MLLLGLLHFQVEAKSGPGFLFLQLSVQENSPTAAPFRGVPSNFDANSLQVSFDNFGTKNNAIYTMVYKKSL